MKNEISNKRNLLKRDFDLLKNRRFVGFKRVNEGNIQKYPCTIEREKEGVSCMFSSLTLKKRGRSSEMSVTF